MAEDRETVIAAAEAAGYRLVCRGLDGKLVWGFEIGDNIRHPWFASEDDAVDYMRDRLRRIRSFDR